MVNEVWDGNPKNWGKGHYRDVPISKYALAARRRQINDLERSLENDPDFPYYFDCEAADYAVWFISQLRHFEGEWHGQDFALSDWQEWDIIRPIFGWKRKSDDGRRFSTAYIEIPRRNGKSTLIAGIGSLLFLGDKEYGAQVYCAATKEAQARIVWDGARRMIELSPTLRKYIKSYRTALVNERLGSVFKPLGRDSKSQDGFSVHGGIIDEYHAHSTAEMYDVLSSGRGSRRQPLLTIITTAGFGVESPCKRESDLTKKILERTLSNESYYGYVTTVDNPADWRNPIEWQKANPNYGISVYREGFDREFSEAEMSPLKQNPFKTKKLNIWTEGKECWIPIEKWKACSTHVDKGALMKKQCWGGLDLSSTTDITAFSLVFPGSPINVLPFFWVPEEKVKERVDKDKLPYDVWVRLGLIKTTPGNVVDYDFILADIEGLAKAFNIVQIAYDPWNATQFSLNLERIGQRVVPMRQGFQTLNAPTKELERIVLKREIAHGGHEVLTWMAANTVVVRDPAGNIKPAKNKSEEKIDGTVATIMGLGAYMVAKPPEQAVYEARGLVMVS